MSVGATWLLVAGIVLALVAGYLSWTAGRLDRHHARVEASAAVLDAQLLRRSGAALDLATSGILDPAASLLVADTASRARTTEGAAREETESDLSAVLRASLGDPVYVSTLTEDPSVAAMLGELAGACRRVTHARRFHNINVGTVRRLRSKPIVRALRLAGHAPLPETVEFDDAVPSGLPG